MSHDLSRRNYSILKKIFIRPLLNQKYSKVYVPYRINPFVYYSNQQDLQRDYPNADFVIVKKPNNNEFDQQTPVSSWRTSFDFSKRRAARWITTPEQILEQYCSWIGINPIDYIVLLDYPLNVVLPLFKKIKTFVHTHYDKLGLNGRYFVDFDSLCGIPPSNMRTMSDDPYQWLTQLVKHEYTPAWWTQRFTETFLDSVQGTPREFLTLEEFAVRRWLWTTEGATKFSRLYLGGEFVRTKFGAAVSLTDSEILALVKRAATGDSDQAIGIFVKPDEASFKRRLIANVPLGGYIIAAYIRYLIEECVGTRPKFYNLAPDWSDKINIITLCKQGYQIVPLDESSYDYHVTRESWQGFINFLHQAFPRNRGVIAFDMMFNNTNWKYGEQHGQWLKGMPSGLALTSLVNSWMNYIKQTTILPGHLNWACGDDVLSVPYQPVSLADIEIKYKRFGSEANASKNWTSYRFGEYLRVLYGSKGTTGYPARIFGTLLFAHDLSYRTPIDRLNENSALWKQLFDRLGIPMDEDLVARDLSWSISNKVNGFSKSTARIWLHAARINGGFGKLPYNDFSFTWIPSDSHSLRYSGNRFRLPPVIKYFGNWTLQIGRVKIDHGVSVRLGEPYRLQPIETEEQWVDRLNRDDIPDKGPFTSLILDPIPLPVVDFVSIANMSLLAQHFGFYSYPNLHGSWNTQMSRLLLAGLQLFRLVNEEMTLHNLKSLS